MSGGTPAVTHLVAPAAFGGLESVVAGLVIGLHRAGAPVRVTTLGADAERPPPMVTAVAGAGVDVGSIRTRPRAYLAQAAAVVADLERSGHLILHSHGYHADLIASLVRARHRISTFHGFTGGSLKNRAYEWLQRRVARRFDAVVAVSAPIRERLLAAGVPAPRVHLIRNALAPGGGILDRAAARRELGLAAAGPVVGWVGRLSAEKGPDLFVAAIAACTVPGLAAILIGDGPLRAGLEDRVRALGIGDRCRFAGPIPDAGRLVAAFDVLALTSRTEGTPMVLLEAMSAGVPVVATSVGGVPDVADEAEARLVPVAAPAIAGAIDAAVADPAGSGRRAEAARQRMCRDFDYHRWLDGYRDLYRGVAG